jgi:hypothetical protein
VRSDQLDLDAGAADSRPPVRVGLATIWYSTFQGGTASTMIGHMRPLSQIVVPTVFPAQ